MRCGRTGTGWDGIPVDRERSAALFAKACNAGHADACYNLGIFCESGLAPKATPVDKVRARELFKRACEMKSERACAKLAESP